MRVLLVEDSEINRRIIREMLAAGEIDMAEAVDGREGLKMIDAADYDLVLMDLRMPEMDGLTALKHLRARTDDKGRVPVIVITADAGTSIHDDCLAAGADEVIPKPVSMPVLYDAIGRMLAKGGDAEVMLL
jgi:CheY-like chemotaxis protein